MTRMKAFLVISTAIVLAVVAYPNPSEAQDALPEAGAMSADQKPEILTPEMKASEAEYRKLREPLSDTQKKLLEKMEEAYLETLAPEMEIARLGLQLKSCKFSKDEKAEAGSIYTAFKLEKRSEQEKMLAAAVSKHKKKIDFLDQAILSTHMNTVMYFGKAVSIDALKDEVAMLTKTDPASVCAQGKETLKAFSEG